MILRTKEQKTIVEKELILLDIQEVMEYTGWSDNVVRRLFAYDKDFPAIKIGKKYQVTLVGLIQYLSTRRVQKEE